MELIRHYFPELSVRQMEQLAALGPLYKEWNEKINVVSRKDIDHLYEHHILHSLALARYNPFLAGMQVLDAGTGGGFPGIPLAIFYPGVNFTLLDSTAKKIHVVQEIARAIELANINAVHSRLEDYQGRYEIVISRAVSTMAQMVAWTKHLVPSKHWIMLKGGEIKEMRKELPPQYQMTFIPVSAYFTETYFRGKFIVDIKGK